MSQFNPYARSPDFILREACVAGGQRENIILAAGQIYRVGCVLGKITNTGRYSALQPGAADGTETACGILCDREVDATDGERLALMVSRMTEVKSEAIDWGRSDADSIAQGKEALASAGVIFR